MVWSDYHGRDGTRFALLDTDGGLGNMELYTKCGKCGRNKPVCCDNGYRELPDGTTGARTAANTIRRARKWSMTTSAWTVTSSENRAADGWYRQPVLIGGSHEAPIEVRGT